MFARSSVVVAVFRGGESWPQRLLISDDRAVPQGSNLERVRTARTPGIPGRYDSTARPATMPANRSATDRHQGIISSRLRRRAILI